MASTTSEYSHMAERCAIKEVMTRYVGQLLYGCGDATCDQVMCATGRRNTSKRPIRDYTPRSARAIALTLVSGPCPRSRLCEKYELSRCKDAVVREEGPLDPSSFMQLLCETEAVRKLCDSNAGVSERASSSSEGDELREQVRKGHHILDRIAEDDMDLWNEGTAMDIFDSLLWLAKLLVQGSRPTQILSYISRIVSLGCAYPDSNASVPSDTSYNNWLVLLDRLDNRPCLRLLCRAIEMAGLKIAEEYKLWRVGVRNERSRFSDYVREPTGRFSKAFLSTMLVLLDTCDVKDQHVTPNEHHQSGENPNVAVCFALLLWIKRAFLHHWNGDHVVEPGTIPATALGMLEFAAHKLRYNTVWQREAIRIQRHSEIFAMPIISARVDIYELVQAYERDRTASTYIFEFDAPFRPHEKALYFRNLCHFRMRQAHSASKLFRELRSSDSVALLNPNPANPDPELKDLEENYLLLNVSRHNALKDAMDELWQREANELLRPLRVRLGQMDGYEVGHDLGGVQTEFFNLICKQLCSEDMQMFTTDPKTGISYFRPGSLQPLHMFELCGVLFGIALHNGIPLAISLPFLFYDNLLGVESPESLAPDVLQDGWPEYAKSLLALWKGNGEGLDAVFPLEANGLRLSVLAHDIPDIYNGRCVLEIVDATRIDHHDDDRAAVEASASQKDRASNPTATQVDIKDIEEAWPGWRLKWADTEPPELSSSTVQHYVENFVFWLTVGSIRPQWNAFHKGFFSVISEKTLRIFGRSENLQLITEGSTHLDIDELRHATQYDDYNPKQKYIQNFWRLVASWPQEKQKQLVKFVTAAERIPAGGASNLTFRISKASSESSDHLPTSSTCFGTLYLPHYPDIATLEKKLDMALDLGLEGFGSG